MYRNLRNILPIIFGTGGGDVAVARSFYEAFGSRAICISDSDKIAKRCKYRDEIKVSDASTPSLAVSAILKLAAEHTGAELFAVTCEKRFVSLMSKIAPMLSGICHVPTPGYILWRTLSDRPSFYSMLRRYGISCPEYIQVGMVEKIKGSARILVTYSNVRGIVCRAVYAVKEFSGSRVLFRTHPLDSICFSLIDFLNSVGFCGAAQFDICETCNGAFVLNMNMHMNGYCDLFRLCGGGVAELVAADFDGRMTEAEFIYPEAQMRTTKQQL